MVVGKLPHHFIHYHMHHHNTMKKKDTAGDVRLSLTTATEAVVTFSSLSASSATCPRPKTEMHQSSTHQRQKHALALDSAPHALYTRPHSPPHD